MSLCAAMSAVRVEAGLIDHVARVVSLSSAALIGHAVKVEAGLAGDQYEEMRQCVPLHSTEQLFC
jgi:hypothetical protein